MRAIWAAALLLTSFSVTQAQEDLPHTEDWRNTVLPTAPPEIAQRIEANRTAQLRVDIKDAAGKSLPAGQDVRIEMLSHEFLFGCNVFNWDGFHGDAGLQKTYRAKFAALFNYCTLPFYWGGYEPSRGATQQARMKECVKWCKANGIRPKGHPLIWHEGYPAWDEALGAAGFESRLRARVTGIISEYAGQIDTWDVINESLYSPQVNNLEGKWVKSLGPTEAVSHALAWAKRANPSGFFLVNDFNLSDDYHNQIAALIAAGNPPSAVGMQAHMHQNVWTNAQIEAGYPRFAALKLPLHITEMTIHSGPMKKPLDYKKTYTDWTTTTEGEARQAADVCRIYRMLFSEPNFKAITWWDFSDYDAWLGAPAGLTRKDMSSKPAYNVLMKLIHDEWRTKTTVRSDASGEVSFRGFFGRYRLTVGGKTAEFDLNSTGPRNMEVRLP